MRWEHFEEVGGGGSVDSAILMVHSLPSSNVTFSVRPSLIFPISAENTLVPAPELPTPSLIYFAPQHFPPWLCSRFYLSNGLSPISPNRMLISCSPQAPQSL